VFAVKKIKKITAALDESTLNILEQLGSEDDLAYSEVIRRAINFYNENRYFPKEKCLSYLNMLSSGEHVIIDVDHWYLFLDFIQSSQNQEIFWTKHKEVARFHGEQLRNKVLTVEDMLKRLEVCNFFKVIKISETDYTLVLCSDLPKKFVITFLEEFFSVIDVKVELKPQLSKICVHTPLMHSLITKKMKIY
jgi:hypothetical protein